MSTEADNDVLVLAFLRLRRAAQEAADKLADEIGEIDRALERERTKRERAKAPIERPPLDPATARFLDDSEGDY